ncbi:MAG: hypothetical protein AAF726_01875 [Planctomycetota bacterium]
MTDHDAQPIEIRTFCPMRWDELTPGKEPTRRHCAQCQRDVIDVSAVSEKEARALLSREEGRTCIRLQLTTDGRTVHAPGRSIRALQRVGRLAAAGVAALAAACGASKDPEPRAPIADVDDDCTPSRSALIARLKKASEAAGDPGLSEQRRRVLDSYIRAAEADLISLDEDEEVNERLWVLGYRL